MSVIHTCSDGLQKLKKGNADHVGQVRIQKSLESFQVGVCDPKQTPFAAILSCADSRVIPEIMFSANSGDLFVVRVAGNISNSTSIASLEYAVKYLHVRVIAVIGHEDCGAVDSAIKQAKGRLNFGPNLNDLLSHIVPAINEPTIDDRVEATKNNARLTAKELLMQSQILREFYIHHGLGVFDGYYHVYGRNAGKVEGIDSWDCTKKMDLE